MIQAFLNTWRILILNLFFLGFLFYKQMVDEIMQHLKFKNNMIYFYYFLN